MLSGYNFTIMNTIKNIHYLDLSEKDLSNLDKSAGLYASNSNITFKILKHNKSTLVVEVRQDKNSKDKYLEAKELAKRTKDLFGHFYPDIDIKVGTKPYKPPVVDVVDPEWIESNMSRKGMRLKDISDITGISSPALSRWINGSDPMSQPVKSMFYFMLNTSEIAGYSINNITDKLIYLNNDDSSYFVLNKKSNHVVFYNKGKHIMTWSTTNNPYKIDIRDGRLIVFGDSDISFSLSETLKKEEGITK